MGEPGLNRAALIFGVFFVLAGAAFLLERLDVWELRLQNIAPVVLIALGIAVLLGGARRGI